MIKKSLLIVICLTALVNAAHAANYALNFDGIDDYTSCGTGASVNITGTTITLEARIYPTDFGANYWDKTIISKEGSSTHGYGLRCGGSGKVSFVASAGWGGEEVVSLDNAITLNNWHHIAGTYDGSNMKLYINGVLAATLPTTHTVSSTDGVLSIGSSAGYGRYFTGKIDEVRVWNITRSASDISNNMNSELVGNEAGLAAYYKMNEGSGTTLTDSTANINTGTISGAGWVSADWMPTYNVTISSSTTNGSWSGGSPDTWTPTAAGSTVSAADIQTKLNAGTSVKITTGSGNGVPEQGTITVSSAIQKTAGVDAALTLEADYRINIQANITSTSNKLNFAATAGKVITDRGRIGQFNLFSGAAITTNGGTITLEGVNNSVTGGTFSWGANSYSCSGTTCRGIEIDGTINAGGGNISLTGLRHSGGVSRGVQINNIVATTIGGSITINAQGDGTSDGASIGAAGIIQAENGNIQITSNAYSTGYGISADAGSRINTTGTGNVSLVSTNGGVSGGNLTLISGGTTSLTAPAGAAITLNNTNNDFTGAVSVSSGGAVGLVDKNSLTLGAVNVSGAVDIASGVVESGDLTLTGAVATTDTTSSAVILNAGKAGVAGSDAGGNLIVSGGTVSFGSGGIAKLYTGSISGSTGVTSLTNYNASQVYYSSDEGSSLSPVPETNKLYVVYREASPSPTATAPASGDGSSGNPYQIATLENLYWIAADSSRWGFHYLQTADIDASATSTWDSDAGWTPIGSSTTKFTGSYDGNNMRISNLYINRPETSYVGLFGYIEAASQYFKRIIIDGGNITGGGPTGAIAGAFFYGIMEDCSSSAAVTGTSNVGGIAGQLVSNSATNGIIRRCSSSGSVTGSGQAGGLVGLNQANGDAGIHHSFATGNVNIGAGNKAGGLVGYNGYASIRNSYSTGTVTGGSEIGGFIGYLVGIASSYIGYNYSTGQVIASGALKGGFLGSDGGGATNADNFWDTETSGQAASQGSGAAGKTSAEMKLMSTFTNWDFLTTWHIDESAVSPANNGYPSLAWQGLTHYVSVTNYTITASKTGTGSGTITSSPAGIDCGVDCSESVLQDTNITLTAAADSGSTFTGWSGGGCAGNGSCIVTVNSDLTVTGNFGTSTTERGYALNFDGSNDYVDLGNDADLEFTGSMTIEAWIKPASQSTISTIASKKYPGGSNTGYSFFVNNWGTSDRRLIFESQDKILQTGENAVNFNQWQHVAVTVSGGTLGKLYINGVEQSVTGEVGLTADTANPFQVGAMSSLYPFIGEIDEFRVWNVARSQAEIQANKDIELTGSEAGLLVYYNFNQGIPSSDNSGLTTVYDKTSNNKNGILTNFTLNGASSNWVMVYPNTYTVTYNGNGNTDGTAPSDQTKMHDVTLTLAINSGSLIKSGSTFAGWNTQADGLGTDYAAGTSYTDNASITLYAKWAINSYYILNNDKLRFGNGSESSITNTGNLQRPFYYNNIVGNEGWKQLTLGYPLNFSIAIDGDGTDEWNLNGFRLDDPVLTGQVIDASAFTSTDGGLKGYGTIISTGIVNVGSKNIEIKNTYELLQAKSYIIVTTRIHNLSGENVSNIRYWVGTQDDFVGNTDTPRKEKGNLVDGSFVQINNQSDRALAIKISTGEEGLLFYTNSNLANTIINSCCSWTNVINQSPQTSAFDVTSDGSYGFYVRLNNLVAGASDEFTWYYAAGQLAELDDIINDVASASSAVSDITNNTAKLTASSDVDGTGYFIVVARDATAPTESQIEVGVDYSGTIIVINGNGAMTANVSKEFSITNLQQNTNYDLYFVFKDTSNTYGSISKNQFTTTALTYTVTGTARYWSGGGSVTPASQTVIAGNTASLTITPTAGSSLSTVTGCGGSLSGVSPNYTYTTGAVNADCEVIATFSLNSYTVGGSVSGGTGGTISPSSRTVKYNSPTTFTITPDWGYHIDSVSGCSGTLSGNIYTTGAVTDNCIVTAVFSLNSYTVTAAATANGTITPSGDTVVTHGSTTAFTITPDSGYDINYVLGCGGSVSGTSPNYIYTTGAVTGNCKVMVFFKSSL